MNFLIKLFNKYVTDNSDNFQVGEITINNYRETFHASLSYWTQSDYIHQWNDAIKHILNGNSKSCLITSMFDPNKANFIFLWSLYLYPNIIYIHNQILFLEQLNKPFDESCIYNSIRDREIMDEEGNQISEWHIQIDDLQTFISDSDKKIESK